MSRFARERRVFFVEAPVFATDVAVGRMDVTSVADGIYDCVPSLPRGLSEEAALGMQRALIEETMSAYSVEPEILWFYDPMAAPLGAGLGAATVYDCTGELAALDGAAARLREREDELLARADLVFTAGHGLWRARCHRHPSVHVFPNSVDVGHFAAARGRSPEPADQASIARPRLGFFGIVDERLDLALIAELASARPDFHLVMIGPIVNIPEASLPRAPNIHWLGHKRYEALPAYLAGWDVALMPFALTQATRFMSPTSTLEYLAAGKPVASTMIEEVVHPYGEIGLVHVGASRDFVKAVESALSTDAEAHARIAAAFVGETSWDRTWAEMNALVEVVLESKQDFGNVPEAYRVSANDSASKSQPGMSAATTR